VILFSAIAKVQLQTIFGLLTVVVLKHNNSTNYIYLFNFCFVSDLRLPSWRSEGVSYWLTFALPTKTELDNASVPRMRLLLLR